MKTCPICSNPTTGQQIYCSRVCQDKAMTVASRNHHNYRETPVKCCLACGTEIPRKLYQSPSVYNRRDYCSRQCSGQAHKERCECGKAATKTARYTFLSANMKTAVGRIRLCASCYALMMQIDQNARQTTSAHNGA